MQENPTLPGASPREPRPLHYIFAIDVSWTSVRCGLIKEVVKGLRELLYPTEEEVAEGRSTGLPAGAKIAIMTFDRTVQFFNLKVSFLSSDRSSTTADFPSPSYSRDSTRRRCSSCPTSPTCSCPSMRVSWRILSSLGAFQSVRFGASSLTAFFLQLRHRRPSRLTTSSDRGDFYHRSCAWWPHARCYPRSRTFRFVHPFAERFR